MNVGDAIDLNWYSNVGPCTATGGQTGDGWAGAKDEIWSSNGVCVAKAGTDVFTLTCGTCAHVASYQAAVTVVALGGETSAPVTVATNPPPSDIQWHDDATGGTASSGRRHSGSPAAATPAATPVPAAPAASRQRSGGSAAAAQAAPAAAPAAGGTSADAGRRRRWRARPLLAERPQRPARPQSSRKPVVTGNRAARIAGSSPPTIPIAIEMTNPQTTSSGVTLKLNTTWVKVCPIVDTVMLLNNT